MTSVSDGAEIRGDTLYLDGTTLNTRTHTPDHFRFVLGSLGRDAIASSIEERYAATAARHPDAAVDHPSLVAIRLGTDRQTLSTLGTYNRTSLHRSRTEINPAKRGYWDIIGEYGFTPEVRSRMGKRATAASYLLLRNPETDPRPITPIDALPAALGFVEPAEYRTLRPRLQQTYSDHDIDTYMHLLERADDEGRAAIDRQGDSHGNVAWAYAQVGFILAGGILRAEIEGDSYIYESRGYRERLVDAEEYAYQLGLDDICTELQREIERIQTPLK